MLNKLKTDSFGIYPDDLAKIFDNRYQQYMQRTHISDM